MDKETFIKRAVDANGFFSTQAEAVDVNPSPVWDSQLREFVRQNLVLAPLGRQVDLSQPGSTFRITIGDEPAAAAALVETNDVSITAFTNRYVTHTPVPYGAAMQLTDQEAARAFFDVASEMVNRLGYMLVRKKDNLVYSQLASGATATVNANGVATSSIASTDTLNLTDIITQRQIMVAAKYVPRYLIISPSQEGQLMKITTLQQANTFGSRNVIGEGRVGFLFGLEVIMSHSVTESSNKATALVVGTHPNGEPAFGIGQKRGAKVEREYHALGRYWDIVATEDFDVLVYHPSAVRGLQTYV